MNDSHNVTNDVHLYDEFGSIMQYRYLPKQGGVLCQCESALLLVSLNGDIITSIPIKQREVIVAAYEIESGWQVLTKVNNILTLFRVTQRDEKRICLEKADPDAKSACWSPCGQFIAIGHASDSSVSVWHTNNGKHIWTRSIKWDVEEFLLDWPPSLTVSGWSEDGKYIVTSADLISSSIVIWCADSGEVQTMINN